MKNAACCFIMMFLILSLSGPIFAQAPAAGDSGRTTAAGDDTSAETSGRVTAVSVSGLKRTRPSVAEQALQKFIGREAADLDLNEVKAVLLDTGIMDPISVEITDAEAGVSEDGGQDPLSNSPGKLIKAEVREKWSIFPVPIFFFGSGGMSAGAAFFDANAFGLNHKAAVAGMYRSPGWMIMGMYNTTPQKGKPGWSFAVFFSRDERRNGDQQDKTLREFNVDSLNGSAAAIFRFTDTLGGSLRLGYNNRMLQDRTDPILPPESGGQILRLGPELSARRSSWDGYLLSEESASFSYAYMQGLDSPSYNSLQFRGTWQKSIVPGFRTDIRTGLLYEPEVPVLFESSPERAAVGILPKSFSAQHYAGLSLGLERYLYKFSFGTLSLLASWQMVYSYGSILENEFDYGIASSISLYLSKLAIPAVGVGVAYNIDKNYFQFSFSMGMSL
jgi:hypothetical protein